MAEYLEAPGPWLPYAAGRALDWYDGPILFEAKIDGADIVAMTITDEDAGDYIIDYIGWDMDRSLPIIQGFLADRISLRDLLQSGKVDIFEIGAGPRKPDGSLRDPAGRRVKRVLLDDVLPIPGLFWSDYHVEDADAQSR